MRLRYISLVILCAFMLNTIFSYHAYGGVVPGTIQKLSYTSGEQECIESSTEYNDNFTGCSAPVCVGRMEKKCEKIDSTTFPVTVLDTRFIYPDTEPCDDTLGHNWRDAGVVNNSVCTGGGEPMYDESIHYSYSDDTTTYTFGTSVSVPSGYTVLGNDFNKQCKTIAEGINGTDPSGLDTTTCSNNNVQYYETSSVDGTCSVSSENIYLDSFNYSGNTNFREDTSDPSDTCTVEGRAAKIDNTGPSITINGGSFNNSGLWCNLDKYKGVSPFSGTYGTPGNINTPGCDSYNTSGGSDLVDDFTVDIQDISGISSVQIELGRCNADYTITTNLDLLVSTPSNGVKSEFTDTLTISSESIESYGGNNIESLKNVFGVSRLDDCLGEGENFLLVTAYDNARSESNGTSLDMNQNTISTASNDNYIKIDNSGPTFDTNTTFTKDTWHNESITGNFVVNDLLGSTEELCTNYTVSGTGVCTGSKPTSSNWLSPVDPITGEYDIYQCDGVDITTSSVCKWECDSGYTYNNITNTCDSTDPYSRNLTGSYGVCSGGVQYKTITCDNSSGSGDTSNCDESDIAGEIIFSRSSVSYTLSKTCTVPVGCFTLGTSSLGGTGSSLCTS